MRQQLAAGLAWEAGGIPQRATAFSVFWLLRGAGTSCCSPHSRLLSVWAAWAKPASSEPAGGSSFASVTVAGCGEGKAGSRLYPSRSHFGTSGTSATLVLPQHGRFHPKSGREAEVWGVQVSLEQSTPHE